MLTGLSFDFKPKSYNLVFISNINSPGMDTGIWKKESVFNEKHSTNSWGTNIIKERQKSSTVCPWWLSWVTLFFHDILARRWIEIVSLAGWLGASSVKNYYYLVFYSSKISGSLCNFWLFKSLSPKLRNIWHFVPRTIKSFVPRTIKWQVWQKL